VLAAIVSSLKSKPVKDKLIIFGEVGLAGEIRPVQRGQERLKEAAKLGFTQAIIPAANQPKQKIAGMDIVAVSRLDEALNQLF
jgi:DNA repair protein RadA/Sms